MANLRHRFSKFLLSGATALLMIAVLPTSANAQHNRKAKFCKDAYNPTVNPNGKLFVSQGAQMYCFGSQFNYAPQQRQKAAVGRSPSGIANVNAANPSEDISPNGTRAYGQSETSVAAVGPYVVEAWNDSTGFFSPCPSPSNKEELTGFSFSNDGGNTFLDLGGLPNAGCGLTLYEGDPSVEAWEYQGRSYFYISSLFADFNTFSLEVAVTACEVAGWGTSAALECGQPTVVATSATGPGGFSSLDKDFASIDPRRGKLYVTYTDFAAGGSGAIAMAACDLASNPMRPVCSNGAGNKQIFLVVAPPDPNFCENEGAYPAVDAVSGDVYVAYEHNWPSVFGAGACAIDPTREVVTRIPQACLALPGPSKCNGPFTNTSVFVTSMSGAFIPGYSRFPMNDFPRIAVSPVYHTVSIVWNDASYNPTGDILLQSWSTGNSFPNPIQFQPVPLDNPNTAGTGWQFLPAMRNSDDDGNLYVSWYGRADPGTPITNVFEAAGISPLTQTTPSNIKITNVGSDWTAVSSDINPNFGDYTDNYVVAVGSYGYPFTGEIDFTAWSDGRLGVPQPFEAHITH